MPSDSGNSGHVIVWGEGRQPYSAELREEAGHLFGEAGKIVLTSNKGFAEWGDVLGDAVIATAILDRLLHHSHVISIRGESYRLREKKRAGLFGAPAQAEKQAKPAKA